MAGLSSGVVGVVGAGIGASVGMMQWPFLRRPVSHARWWMWANAVGWAVGFALVMRLVLVWISGGGLETPAVVFAGVVGFFVVGAGIGIMQWFILRRQVSRASWWMLANAVGWAVGLGGAMAVVGSMVVVGGVYGGVIWTIALVGGVTLSWAVGGTVGGAITGFALVWLLRQPVPEV